ncbi:MAG: ATP-binding protein, partial [bacterium]|nr:ATP-binding protein [bacterium]
MLRRLVHPLMLVDLIVLLAFAGSRWWQIDLRALRILRIPDLLARISRTLAGIDLAAGEVPFAEVQEARQQELAAARDALAGAAQQDLSELHEQLTKTTAAVRQVQQRWLLSARSNLELARQEVPATRSEVERLLTDLGEHLLAPHRLDTARQAMQVAYEDTARVYDDVTRTVVDVRDLQWRGRLSYTRVPTQQIGQHHFAGMTRQWGAAFAGFARVYGDGLRDNLEGVRSAMGFPFDMVERGDVDAGSTTQLQTVLSRAVNRCRDLDEPARVAWEQAQLDLEVAHINRVELVQSDVHRYGRIEFYLARVARGITSQFGNHFETGRNAVVHVVPKAWLTLVTAYRDARQLLSPALEWIGLVRPPAAETLEQAEQARLESAWERGLPADYLTHFRIVALEDDTLLVGLDSELAQIDQAIGRWEAGQASSFLVHGPRGGDKTSLLNVAERRLFGDGAQVTRGTVEAKITDKQALVLYLGQLLGVVDIVDIDGLAAALLAGPRRAVILEGCHNLYLRRIGGLDAIR